MYSKHIFPWKPLRRVHYEYTKFDNQNELKNMAKLSKKLLQARSYNFPQLHSVPKSHNSELDKTSCSTYMPSTARTMIHIQAGRNRRPFWLNNKLRLNNESNPTQTAQDNADEVCWTNLSYKCHLAQSLEMVKGSVSLD